MNKPKTTAIKLDKTKTASFELSLKKEIIADSYHKNLKKISESIELKGFRKGKAPIDLVEKSLDKSKIYSYVLEDTIPKVYADIVKSSSLAPISEPRITPLAMPEGQDWTFKVEVATMPEFELGDYKTYLKKALDEHSKVHKHDDKATKEEQDNHKLGIIFDSLLKNIDFALSPILVETESKAALSRLVQQLNSLNLKVADYAKSLKKTEQELVAEYEQNATLRLRLDLILQKLQEALKPEVKDRKGVLDFLLML